MTHFLLKLTQHMHVITANHFIRSAFCFTQGLTKLITSRTTSIKTSHCAHGKQ